MNIKPILIYIVTLLSSVFIGISSAFCQSNDIDFVIGMVKNEYPGISTSDFDKKVKKYIYSDRHNSDTFNIISRFLNSFNNKHLIIYDFNYKPKKDDSLGSIIKVNEVKRQLKIQTKRKMKLVGYWLNSIFFTVIGIVYDSKEKKYIGYVIRSNKESTLESGSIALEIKKERNSLSTDYVDIRSGYRVLTLSRLKNDSVLITGPYAKWFRLKDIDDSLDEKLIKPDFESSVRIVDSNNVVLTLPDFGSYNIKYIDSIVKANRVFLLRAQNLIIDIRNNFGGVVNCYYPLIDYVYTNPIITQSTYIYNTPATISSLEKSARWYLDNGDMAKYKKRLSQIEYLRRPAAKSLLISGDTISRNTETFFPKNIGIVVNYSCMSAAELMLLDFRQSSKVLIFGERTAGAVDYLDYFETETPRHKYSLFIPKSKRFFKNKSQSYERTGIKPDIEIIEEHGDWIRKAIEFYEKD